MNRLILILLARASPLAFGESDGNCLMGACGAAVHLADGYHGSATEECGNSLQRKTCRLEQISTQTISLPATTPATSAPFR